MLRHEKYLKKIINILLATVMQLGRVPYAVCAQNDIVSAASSDGDCTDAGDGLSKEGCLWDFGYICCSST